MARPNTVTTLNLTDLQRVVYSKEIQMAATPVLKWAQFAQKKTETQKNMDKAKSEAIEAGKDKIKQYAYSLIKGSVHSFNFVLAKSLYNGSNQKEGVEIFNQGKQHYLDFMDHAEQKILHELLKTDARSRNLAEKIKPLS